MQPFTTLEGLVVPIDRANVNTDATIPKQFMKSISRTGCGVNLFDEWRYFDHGEPGQEIATRQPGPDFPLNLPRYAGAKVLLTRDNFVCGIRAVISPSFADIFYGNCFKNDILPVVLDAQVVQTMFDQVEALPGFQLQIGLEGQTVQAHGQSPIRFDIDAERKRRLLAALDDVALTLEQSAQILAYETGRRAMEPWLFHN
jgi:3-isopropylmalate/(R)-2-methylmalate dehydratase small subunit